MSLSIGKRICWAYHGFRKGFSMVFSKATYYRGYYGAIYLSTKGAKIGEPYKADQGPYAIKGGIVNTIFNKIGGLITRSDLLKPYYLTGFSRAMAILNYAQSVEELTSAVEILINTGEEVGNKYKKLKIALARFSKWGNLKSHKNEIERTKIVAYAMLDYVTLYKTSELLSDFKDLGEDSSPYENTLLGHIEPIWKEMRPEESLFPIHYDFGPFSEWNHY